MSNIAIRCEGLSKQYRIGKRERYRALRDNLTEGLSRSGSRGSHFALNFLDQEGQVGLFETDASSGHAVVVNVWRNVFVMRKARNLELRIANLESDSEKISQSEIRHSSPQFEIQNSFDGQI